MYSIMYIQKNKKMAKKPEICLYTIYIMRLCVEKCQHNVPAPAGRNATKQRSKKMKIENFLTNLYKKQEKQHEINKIEHQDKQEILLDKLFNTNDEQERIELICQLRDDQLAFKKYKESFETTQLIIKALLTKKDEQ